MSYLDRLRAEISGKCQPRELTKPTEAPSVTSVSGQSRRVSEAEGVTQAAEVRPDPAEVSGCWLIVQPPQRLEKFFTPPITRAELAQRHPGALLVALPDTIAPPREEGQPQHTAPIRHVMGGMTLSPSEITQRLTGQQSERER